jgi:hypothetical protein
VSWLRRHCGFPRRKFTIDTSTTVIVGCRFPAEQVLVLLQEDMYRSDPLSDVLPPHFDDSIVLILYHCTFMPCLHASYST